VQYGKEVDASVQGEFVFILLIKSLKLKFVPWLVFILFCDS
jgi:hypothetical protein